MKVVRFGVSIEKNVLQLLDNYIEDNQFPNRSQAIRHLIQRIEVEKQWQSDEVVGGSITLLFDHHKRDLLDKITDIQHDYHHLILCSQHIHLDHDNCMEIIAVKGKATLLKQLANALTAVKGIIHGELSMTKIN
ncbi:nickel-responsive transcriptional regulator NikR [Chitinophaga nivalis]|uniref:Putative nickel-responsive regulator n=1 Tax=Chitinophaga nivalis TaxID=2991709 RepID=A0ABT3IN48_9BACT|nr:nickel-responsive transcriptional regulator NikR [Chitinophaga nivalis]MCW3464923.1 nickel-responsive transcriptional regulator NikR [Chitinophaga nivalis]MCW3485385.1 nickel-responsive transcriptional regulator NikR [Chitinophaga nivalis]